MSEKTVLVTAPNLSGAAQEILRSAGWRMIFMPEQVDEAMLMAALQAEAAQAILLRGSKPITRAVLACSPHLKLIAKNGVGVDSVDLVAAKDLGIAVKVATGANADAVAEHALAMMLSLMRELPGLSAKLRSGGWEGSGFQGRDFRGSCVGIVGYGEIGRRTAQLARALGARVIVHRIGSPDAAADDFATEQNLAVLLSQVDVLSLHCPLTECTRHLIGAAELATMKRGSFLINTGRGALVDEAALIAALHSGQIAGAGLDTFEQEPLPADSPLFQLDNVILTPHVAGVTKLSSLNVATTTAHNIVHFFA